MPNILYPGTVRAHAHPMGKERSWATSCARSRQRQSNIPHPFPGSHVGGRGKWATNRANGDTGVSKVEKLIETGYENGPKEPNSPCAKGISWHIPVVRVGDGGPHFGVGRLIFPFC
jgi:hypothetical protein